MRIKDASSIVLLDRRGDEPRILMGRRAAKHKFMPNIYVFPGGRVDYGDRFAPYAADYDHDTLELLMQKMKGRPSSLRARMIGLAAVRETFEEVGLMIGRRVETTRQYSQLTWAEFAKAEMQADLSGLTYLVRAITPPGHNRRFDTRFFMADVSDYLSTQAPKSSDELEDVQWVTMKEAHDLPLHFITTRVLLATKQALENENFGKKALNVAFYNPKKRGTRDVAKVLTYLRPGAEPLEAGEVDISKG